MIEVLAGIFQTFRHYYSPEGLQELAAAGGIYLLVAIIFAETGLLIGFFLPGDSLLLVAGLLLKRGLLGLSLPVALAVLAAAAVIGDWVNFWMGAKAGHRAWQWKDGRLFKHRHLVEAKEFYDRYGGPAIALCRFVPVARTFVPFVAGLSRMRFRQFMLWNAVGGSAWVASMLLLGYWLGHYDWLVKRIDLIVLIVVAVSVLPLVIHAVRRWMKGRRAGFQQTQPNDQTPAR